MRKVDHHKVKSSFVSAGSRLLFLDLDGTLSPLFDLRSSISLSGKIKSALDQLASDPKNQLVVISGRTREDLDAVIGGLPVVLVAEHGGFFREQNGKWKARFPVSVFWKPRIRSAMEALTDLYAGSSIEEKQYSICWHYRLVKSAISEVDIRKILSILQMVSNRNEFYIDHDKFTVEARTVGIDKGTFAAQWMWGQRPFDFILAIGDGNTDEDLFDAVGPDHFTIRVGSDHHSRATYWLEKQSEVESLLLGLIGQSISPS